MRRLLLVNRGAWVLDARNTQTLVTVRVGGRGASPMAGCHLTGGNSWRLQMRREACETRDERGSRIQLVAVAEAPRERFSRAKADARLREQSLDGLVLQISLAQASL